VCERERKMKKERGKMIERKNTSRETVCVSVCVCVCAREREREREASHPRSHPLLLGLCHGRVSSH
jgi:hypothetical protein